MDPNDILTCYSLALYSNWFYHKPTRCLFDAGEGVATALGKKVFGIRCVFISHGHEDHIAGISNLVNVRNLAAGAHEKPLTIYYPRHDRWIDALFEYVEKKQSGLLRYPLYVQPLDVGDEIELEEAKRPTKVIAFESKHAKGQLCLGFEIVQERKVIDEGAGEPVLRYHPIFFYSGDGFESYHFPYGRADLAVHEATFLAGDAGEAAARIGHRHCTVERAVEWAASRDVKALLLCHISDRYDLDDVVETAQGARAASGFRGELFAAYRAEIVRIEDSGAAESAQS